MAPEYHTQARNKRNAQYALRTFFTKFGNYKAIERQILGDADPCRDNQAIRAFYHPRLYNSLGSYEIRND